MTEAPARDQQPMRDIGTPDYCQQECELDSFGSRRRQSALTFRNLPIAASRARDLTIICVMIIPGDRVGSFGIANSQGALSKFRSHRMSPVCLFFPFVAFGCAGPPSLSRAIFKADRDAYAAAVADTTKSPKDAFLTWKAKERGISAAEAARRDAAMSTVKNPFSANRDRSAVSLGAVVYSNHCQRCHGENVDGRGPDVLPVAPCKDFHAFDKRFAATVHGGAPRTWFAKIRDGHGGIVQYPDGPGCAMPAFGKTLSNEQIWLAITYLQSLDMYIPPATGE